MMHISVRHHIFYDFSSGVTNVKNKEKKKTFVVVHFYKVFKPCPAIILNLLWVVFMEYSTKCRSIYTQASPVMQLN